MSVTVAEAVSAVQACQPPTIVSSVIKSDGGTGQLV